MSMPDAYASRMPDAYATSEMHGRTDVRTNGECTQLPDKWSPKSTRATGEAK